jgi:thioredoxin reductase
MCVFERSNTVLRSCTHCVSQAERWGSQLLPEDVESVDLQQRPFVVRGSETVRRANSIIVATGATAKRWGLLSAQVVDDAVAQQRCTAGRASDGSALPPAGLACPARSSTGATASAPAPSAMVGVLLHPSASSTPRSMCSITSTASSSRLSHRQSHNAAGASPGFKNQELAVVGGGDTALEEAFYLTKYGKHVHLLVRSERMRASKTMQVTLQRSRLCMV